MKIKAVLAALALAVMPLSTLSAQKYDGIIDKTVALVGNSMILLSQIESEVQMMQFQGYVSDRNLRCEVLENMMVSKLFYTQAQLDSLAVNPDMVDAALEDRVNNILSQLGGEEQVEKYFGKPLHKLRQEWRETFMEQNLAQEMQREVAGKITEVTPKEVQQFYKSAPKDSLPIIPTQYQYSQIVLYPNVERAKLAVRERMLEFRQRILDGEKLSVLATLYSEDPGSAMRGGELGMASRSIFWPAFSDIIQLITKSGDMFNARHILLKPKYTVEDRDSAFIRLDSIRTVVLEDSLTFDQAARIYSQDAKSRTNGGQVSDPATGAPMFDVDRLKPADYNVLKNMKEGEISQPFESVDDEGRSGNTVYKIVRLEKIRPSHPASFEEDFNVLLDIATNQKSVREIEKFIKEKQETTYIVIDPMFQKCDFRRDGWVK